MGATVSRPRRDGRIDILRGAALLMIFVDHIGNNTVSEITLRNWQFSDAAELFVLLAGVSSMLAYGRVFEEHGVRVGALKVARRCLHLYAAQVVLLLATLAIIALWAWYFGAEFKVLEPSKPAEIGHAVRLAELPTFLDILPLYIVLLGCFPVFISLWRLSPWALLVPSLVVWRLAQVIPWLNIHNTESGIGWFFNPFAWQLLFTLGMALAVVHRKRGFSLPRRWWLRGLAVAYILYALVAMAPWIRWGWSEWHPIVMPVPDKSTVDPRRVLDIAAIILLALSSDRFLAAQDHWALRPLAICGRHSLEVFAAGTILSLFGRLLFTTFGIGWDMQIVVNGGGFAIMIAIGAWLDRRARQKRARAAPA